MPEFSSRTACSPCKKNKIDQSLYMQAQGSDRAITKGMLDEKSVRHASHTYIYRTPAETIIIRSLWTCLRRFR